MSDQPDEDPGAMIANVVQLLGASGKALDRNVAGLTHDDSLVQPGPEGRDGGNCLNWVVGHLAATRASILTGLGVDLPWPAGLPSGFQTFWQVWIDEPVFGWAATNGLLGTTP